MNNLVDSTCSVRSILFHPIPFQHLLGGVVYTTPGRIFVTETKKWRKEERKKGVRYTSQVHKVIYILYIPNKFDFKYISL
jgi:hypothetical protein